MSQNSNFSLYLSENEDEFLDLPSTPQANEDEFLDLPSTLQANEDEFLDLPSKLSDCDELLDLCDDDLRSFDFDQLSTENNPQLNSDLGSESDLQSHESIFNISNHPKRGDL